jgi:hypothetical protein
VLEAFRLGSRVIVGGVRPAGEDAFQVVRIATVGVGDAEDAEDRDDESEGAS